MIEKVESLDAELQAIAFVKGSGLGQGQIEVGASRPVEEIAWQPGASHIGFSSRQEHRVPGCRTDRGNKVLVVVRLGIHDGDVVEPRSKRSAGERPISRAGGTRLRGIER